MEVVREYPADERTAAAKTGLVGPAGVPEGVAGMSNGLGLCRRQLGSSGVISQSPRGIFINQSKYALESLKKYNFESCEPVDTPMVEKSKLDEDKEGKCIDPSHYHAGSRDRPPMLATGRYPQWRSRFLRYIDTRPNGDALRKCILSGPYKATTVLVQAVPATDDSPAIPEHTKVETPMNMSPANKAHFEAEKEAIHLILTRIGDEIYSTVDSGIQCFNCKEFGHFAKECRKTKRVKDYAYHKEKMLLCKQAEKGESNSLRDSYLVALQNKQTEFENYKAFNDRTVDYDKLEPQEMWEAIERLQQGESLNIQDPEWSRFVTIVKQQHKLDEVSYHKLFNILKQYQKEVNELRSERLARNADPLSLVATAQANQDPFYQTSKSQKSYAPSSKPSILTRSHTTTRYKGKEIAKPITPPSENQRTMNVARARENVGSPVVQQSGIQCFNYKEFGHFAKECRKPKRVKDSAYHKEKMLLCKLAKKGVPLQAEQYDWLADTDDDIDEQKLEAHYSYMAQIQEVFIADSCTDFEPLEQNDQNDVESDDERVALANLISNLKLDVKNDTVWNEQASNVFRKEREQYFKIQDLKAQLQDKNIAISELKKLIEKCKGKSVETKVDKPSVVRQPNAQRIPKPSVLGVNHKTNVSRPHHRSNQIKDKAVPL
nr:uncharacterized mitochondrial protein AtMg00810-like [Tanacetum cinerariifolium]